MNEPKNNLPINANAIPADRYKLYQEAKKIVELRIAFFIHLGIYLAVNVLLFFINLVNADETGYWFVWPALFWGFAVLVHGTFVLFFTRRNFYKWQIGVPGRRKNAMLLGLGLHWALFTILNLLLFVINALTYRHDPDMGFWSIWITLGWGIGIAFHSVWAYLNKDHKLKRWRRRKAIQIMDSWGRLP